MRLTSAAILSDKHLSFSLEAEYERGADRECSQIAEMFGNLLP